MRDAADPVAAALAWMRRRPRRHRRPATSDPLFRHALFRAGAEHFLWYQRVHHIALDGFGLSLVARRVAEVYTALVAGAEPPAAQFGALATVVEEDLAYLESEQCRRDREYWVGRADGRRRPVGARDRHRPAGHGRSYGGALDVDVSTVDLLKSVARGAGVYLERRRSPPRSPPTCTG